MPGAACLQIWIHVAGGDGVASADLASLQVLVVDQHEISQKKCPIQNQEI